MTQTLPVHISRDSLHSLEVPASFEAEGSFDIRLINHGGSLHVHLHLDDSLAEVADLDAGNHYVEGDAERAVRVDVDPEAFTEETQFGKLKVASAYGAQTRWIDITVAKPDPESQSVQVDESLATPQPKKEPEPSLLEDRRFPVLALGGVALVIALLTAVLFQEAIVTAGAVIVLAGVIAAVVFLSREDL